MRKFAIISALTSAGLMLSACGAQNPKDEADAFPIVDNDGERIGTWAVKSLETGGVKLHVSVRGLEPGKRAMHIHETGSCIGNFKSAGGHFNPHSVAHGNVEDGPHAGDMMNVEIDADGNGVFMVDNTNVSLRGEGGLPALMDSDGSALIIHGGADDYESQPSGAAGPRVACVLNFRSSGKLLAS